MAFQFMAIRGFRSLLFHCLRASFSAVELSGSAFGQEVRRKAHLPPPSTSSRKDGDAGIAPYLRDHLNWNWNQRGRTVPRGESAAGLRFRAYRQKMAMRASRAAARCQIQHLHLCHRPHTHPSKERMSGAPAALSVSTAWVPLGPAPLASDATGDGVQDYNWVSGRATSVLIDPADTSGNTVLLGGAYGGLWKSTNAGSLSSNPAAVVWQPLIDDQPTLAVGAIALQPGNSNVILVGTGETNSSGDSYYGLGILLSTDARFDVDRDPGIGQAPEWTNRFWGSVSARSLSARRILIWSWLQRRETTACALVGKQRRLEATVLFLPWPGRRWEFDGARTLLLAEWWSDVEPRNPHGRRRSRIGHGGDLQPEPGSERDVLRFHPASRAVLIDGWPELHAADYATDCGTGIGALSGGFERNDLPDLSRRVRGGTGAQRDVCVGGRRAAGQQWKSGARRRGHLANRRTAERAWTQIPDNGITNCGDSAFGPNSGCGVEQGWYNLELAAIPDPPPPIQRERTFTRARSIFTSAR